MTMVHSLRFRLLLTLIGVVTVAVGTVALLASQVSASELQRYAELNMQRRNQLLNRLLMYYTQHPSLDDTQAMAAQMAQELGQRIIVTDSAGSVLADSSQRLVGQMLGCELSEPALIVTLGKPRCISELKSDPVTYASMPMDAPGDLLFVGGPISITQAPDLVSLTRGIGLSSGKPISDTALFSMVLSKSLADGPGQQISIRWVQDPAFDPIKAGFTHAVNRSLMLAVAAAGLVALVLTLVLSQRILGPVEALTAAARALEKGDLSRRVPAQSQDEIGELARAFNAMAEGLARLEQLRRNMVTDVAHELRTPLTNIRGYLEAVREGVAHPSPALIDSLHEEALLLNRLVDDLQDLALAEAGQLKLLRQMASVQAIVEKAVSALAPTAVAKGVAIGVDLPPDLPPVSVDVERVGQVLRNLLNNAIRHTPPTGSIVVSAATTGAQIAVSVRDTGIGISPEDMPYLFERFYRADRSRARATGGAGLGLTIVKQLIEAHGGRVWAESTPGQGACFTFTLPA
jgi:signal transduction histidine kinase